MFVVTNCKIFQDWASIYIHRNAIGIELNDEYYKIGIRRTNIANEYDGQVLKKEKVRKTKNKSKKDHELGKVVNIWESL